MYLRANFFYRMALFISSGEIAIILLFILIFFGADKIPEFAKFMGKGAREFKKATDDIKREFTESSSEVMKDFKSIGDNLTESITKNITEPIQKTANETQKTFEEYHDQIQDTASETQKTFEEYNDQFKEDYYYNNVQDDFGSFGNEFKEELQENTGEFVSETSETTVSDNAIAENVSEPDTSVQV